MFQLHTVKTNFEANNYAEPCKHKTHNCLNTLKIKTIVIPDYLLRQRSGVPKYVDKVLSNKSKSNLSYLGDFDFLDQTNKW